MDKLESHLRCHSSDRPYKCALCDESFKDRASLLGHGKSSHQGGKGGTRYFIMGHFFYRKKY